MHLMRTLTAACLLWSVATAAEAQQAVLKFSHFTSDQEARWVRVLKPFIDAVNADPSGALKIEAFPNGALGRNLGQQPQMVLDGVADIAFTVPSLSSGRFPDDTIFEIPGLSKDLAEGTKLYEELVKQNVLRGYSDYVALGTFANANFNFYSRRPTKSLADLKGQKARISGPVLAQTARELGMVPVLMPPNEAVEALGRGTVDSIVTEPAALIDFGLDRVTSHDYMLEVGTTSHAILMSRAKFDALPQAAKDVLLKHAGTAFNERYTKAMTAYMSELHQKLKSDPKRTIVEPSAADRAQAQQHFANVKKEWAAKDPRNAELLAKAEQILTDLRSKKTQ